MYFTVVGTLTATVAADGTVTLRNSAPSHDTSPWRGVDRARHVIASFAGGQARMTVYRGEVSLVAEVGGYGTWRTSFHGPHRYMRAQASLRYMRREAARWVDSCQQLAAITARTQDVNHQR
jgi:hypothetical protein